MPSTLTSFYSIDATVENQFSCQINGNSPTIKYRVKIMKNDKEIMKEYPSPDELDSLEEDLGVVPVDSIQLNNGNMLLLCM